MRKKDERWQPNYKLTQKLASTVLALTLIVCMSFVIWCSDARAADRFKCYTGCSRSLESSTECQKSEDPDIGDYKVEFEKGSGDVTVLAIHAGSIEPNTGKIAKKIAKDNKWTSYIFMGHIKNQACKALVRDFSKPNFDVLHITSENFNDPVAIEAVRSRSKTISIHGHGQHHAPGSICVGGLNKDQRDEFISYVKSNASSFKRYELNPIDTTQQNTGNCSENFLRGVSPHNIVNKNSSDMGLQLELNSKMRKDLVKPGEEYKQLQQIFYSAVTQAMKK